MNISPYRYLLAILFARVCLYKIVSSPNGAVGVRLSMLGTHVFFVSVICQTFVIWPYHI